ncbi:MULTISPECIES: recombinase family protein [Burkholderia cepacia complex]|uniref:recombinase family protein n=1 Tax=Burkholderia cepacia complex TaxID=87882 RepID=UPI0007562E34|nr:MULTISPECIES: recombinase family protein [Burkholderia cepacia complex]KVX59326.1 resolvase [Burkholderia cepacia]KWD63390.1 resolvase [Burkholderia cepacia]KWD84416.1 resolvase [Burkholderia cepacia]MBR8188787.1 recombinase family protein [Burkholderia vietnamiensis]
MTKKTVARHVFAYLRASTKEQDATRARTALEQFAGERGVRIAAEFVENESGATLKRPELFRLIAQAKAGDVLLLEQVDRLARLNEDDWKTLRRLIDEKGIVIVSMDLPTSHDALDPKMADTFTGWMLGAINRMMLDMLAAVARKDYEDRRRRQAEGIAKAKDAGKFKGRPVDTEKRRAIADALKKGLSWSWIVENLDTSRATVASVAAELKAN